MAETPDNLKTPAPGRIFKVGIAGEDLFLVSSYGSITACEDWRE